MATVEGGKGGSDMANAEYCDEKSGKVAVMHPIPPKIFNFIGY